MASSFFVWGERTLSSVPNPVTDQLPSFLYYQPLTVGSYKQDVLVYYSADIEGCRIAPKSILNWTNPGGGGGVEHELLAGQVVETSDGASFLYAYSEVTVRYKAGAGGGMTGA